MKISYRTHPVLGLINGINHNVGVDSRFQNRHKLLTGLNYVFQTYKDRLNKNVIVVSDTFLDAAISCTNKMISNDLFKEIGDNLTGVLLINKMSIIYDAKRVNIDGKDAWSLNIIEFFAGDALRSFNWEGVANYAYFDEHSTSESVEFEAKNVWHLVQTVLMFKKFAQVETKELPAGKKVKDVLCNYKNETKSNVILLDSKWFTTLVKSDAFNVRGHFRLQPKKKDGEWTKELIWINEFQKEGYTAPARKLKEDA